MSGIISDNLSKSSGLIKSASVSVDYVKLATYATSGAESELVCDGDFSSDYKHYLYFFNYIYPSNSSNAAHFYMRYRSGGSTLTGSNWKISNSGGYNDLNGSQSSNVWAPEARGSSRNRKSASRSPDRQISMPDGPHEAENEPTTD